MAYAFRSASTTTPASGLGLAINKPAGGVDGDLAVVVGYTEAASWASGGSGFNSSAALEIQNTAGASVFWLKLWWKILSGDPASWTFTPSGSAWRSLTAALYSGALGTGLGRVDTQSSAQADGVLQSNQNAPSVTTTANGDLVVFAYGNFSGDISGSASGFATGWRADSGGCAIADAIKTTPGATGTTTIGGGSVGTEDYAALHVAFLLDSGSAGETGQDRASLSLKRRRWPIQQRIG